MFKVQIYNRLKDIKGSSLPFGGVSIVAIGDLFQLQPVMDGYILFYIVFLLLMCGKNFLKCLNSNKS